MATASICYFDVVFVRSGSIGLPYTSGTLRYAGISNNWWSSSSKTYTSSVSADAYNLYYNNTTTVHPSNYSARLYGFSLRCLSTVLDI